MSERRPLSAAEQIRRGKQPEDPTLTHGSHPLDSVPLLPTETHPRHRPRLRNSIPADHLFRPALYSQLYSSPTTQIPPIPNPSSSSRSSPVATSPYFRSYYSNNANPSRQTTGRLPEGARAFEIGESSKGKEKEAAYVPPHRRIFLGREGVYVPPHRRTFLGREAVYYARDNPAYSAHPLARQVDMDESLTSAELVIDGLVSLSGVCCVFSGFTIATLGQHSLVEPLVCGASIAIAERVIAYGTTCFSLLAASSLVASGLKALISVLKKSADQNAILRAHIRSKVLRIGLVGAILLFVLGGVFLMLYIIDMDRIRLGRLSCGSGPTVLTVITCILIPLALVAYLCTVVVPLRRV